MDVPEGKKNIGGDDSKGQLNANQNFSRFLPYQTNKDCSQKTAYTHQKITKKKCYDPYLYGIRAEILVIFGLNFGRNDDLINSFWI